MRSMLLAVALALAAVPPPGRAEEPPPAAAEAPAPAPVPAEAPPPAAARPPPPTPRAYLTLRVSRVAPLKNDDLKGFDGGWALAAALGVRLSSYLAVELEGGRLSLDGIQTGLVGGILAVNLKEDVVAYPAIASVRLVGSTRAFEFSGFAGGGFYFMSGELEASTARSALKQQDSDAPFAFHVGGRVAFKLTERVLLGAEVRYVVGETDMFLDVFDGPTPLDSLTLGATVVLSL